MYLILDLYKDKNLYEVKIIVGAKIDPRGVSWVLVDWKGEYLI